MNLKIFVYIFSLFIILTPSFFVQQKESLLIHFIHAFLFTFIIYLTFDIVKSSIEGLQNDVEIKLYGISNLAEMAESITGNNFQDITFGNNINYNQGVLTSIEDINANCPQNLECSVPPTNAEATVLRAYKNVYDEYPSIAEWEYYKPKVEKYGFSQDDVEMSLKNSLKYLESGLADDDANFYTTQNNIYDLPQKCGADFGQISASNGQFGNINDNQFICDENKPICNNYIYPYTWGFCTSNQGVNGNSVEVIGDNARTMMNTDSNIQNEWAGRNDDDNNDYGGNSKWIWFTRTSPNNDKCAVNSYCTFEYKYYKSEGTINGQLRSMRQKQNGNLDNATMYILSYNECIVYSWSWVMEDDEKKLVKTKLGQSTGPNSVTKIDFTLNDGVNHFLFYVMTESFSGELTKGGLLVSVVDNYNKDIIFETGPTWTYIHTLPPLESKCMQKENIDANTKSAYFPPIISLWNRKNKGFLQGQLEKNPWNEDAKMNLSFMKSHDKKLVNSLHSESAMFKVMRQDNNNNLLKLFSFSNQQNCEINTQSNWEPIYNSDFTVSFKSESGKYLAVLMVNGILSIRLNENLDPSCKWEIVPINTTYVGNTNNISSSNQGYEGTTTIHTKYIGQYPVNMQENTNYFICYNLQPNTNTKKFTINYLENIDSTSTQTWSQPLALCSVQEEYSKSLEQTFSISIYGKSNEMIIANGTIIIIVNGLVKYRSINDPNPNETSWRAFTIRNTKTFKNLTVGKYNGRLVVMAISNNTLYVREFGKFLDGAGWIVTDYNNVEQVEYNFIDDQLYAIDSVNKNLIILGTNTTYPSINLQYFKFIYQNNAYSLYGINSSNILVYIDLSQPSQKILDNTEITKFDVHNNVIYAINKNTKTLVYKPITYQSFIPYDTTNIIDVNIYNDQLYAISPDGNILTAPILNKYPNQ
jgi:hypothetical protein